MNQDLLAGARWECVAVEPGSGDPFVEGFSGAGLTSPIVEGLVPGTAAAALVAAGIGISHRDFDADDWWYRARFSVAPRGLRDLRLHLAGLATICDVWLNGRHVLRSENMFLPQTIEIAELAAENQLVLRFSSLKLALSERRRRPRWKVARLGSQNLRWFRTTLLGRMTGWPSTPAPVGPWAPISILPVSAVEPTVRKLKSGFAAGIGSLDVEVESDGASEVILSVAERQIALTPTGDGLFGGRFHFNDVRSWWPHTHGDQPLYSVEVAVDGARHSLGKIGFRSVRVDRLSGGFELSVNEVPVFCRGAHWTPLNQISLVDDPSLLRSALEQVRSGSMNMVRVGGETVYPSREFLQLCDELGLLVWQDCMIAFFDVPDDPAFQESVAAEIQAQMSRLAGHPCVAVVSGGSEIEQQAAFYGLPLSDIRQSPYQRLMAELAHGVLDIPAVTSTPTGGALPTDPRTGIAHYFGVGAYLRAPEDARRSAVRFAAECLSFAIPPERVTVDAAFGSAAAAGHHPAWKAAVYRDGGASWDFEDVREHYVRTLFGEQMPAARFADPERALDLGRAAIAELFTATLSEWRRPGSTCAGALVFHHHDSVLGAGLGIVDASGRPKSAWYAMRRTMTPIAVLITDEGLGGLDAHVVNDTPDCAQCVIQVELIVNGEMCVESVERPVIAPARQGITLSLTEMFDGFRDLNHAYHFGPQPFDGVVVSLFKAGQDPSEHGPLISQAVYAPGIRAVESDVGLTATLSRAPDSRWSLEIGSRRFAQWVSVECEAAIPADSWFHLAPGAVRTIALGAGAAPRGTVRAVNSRASAGFAASAE